MWTHLVQAKKSFPMGDTYCTRAKSLFVLLKEQQVKELRSHRFRHELLAIRFLSVWVILGCSVAACCGFWRLTSYVALLAFGSPCAFIPSSLRGNRFPSPPSLFLFWFFGQVPRPKFAPNPSVLLHGHFQPMTLPVSFSLHTVGSSRVLSSSLVHYQKNDGSTSRDRQNR